MTFSEVKKFIYELVKRYHPGAMVVWTKTKGVTPKPPYITLGYSNLNLLNKYIVEDEGIVDVLGVSRYDALWNNVMDFMEYDYSEGGM